MTQKQIALDLCISEGTAKVYAHRLYQKLGVRNRQDLLQLDVKSPEYEQPGNRTSGDSTDKNQQRDHTMPSGPPLNAQFLLDLFMPESRCEEFLGCLEERYNRKLARLGKKRADWWYHKQVATSLWPLFRAFAGRLSKSSLSHVLCFWLRLLGQGSWADALRKAADEERKRSI
jgi:hypothetical protein